VNDRMIEWVRKWTLLKNASIDRPAPIEIGII
jgi:hypothetical protein